MQGDPAGEALPHLAAQELEVDIVIGADHALEGDRDDVAERFDEVHPGVVVVDDAAGFLDDGPPDLLDGVLAAHPGGRRLEDGELGGSRRGLLDELAVVERDRRMRSDGADEGDVMCGPVARLAAGGGEHTDRLPVAQERRDQVALGDRPAGAQHLADRTLVEAGQRQSGGRVLVDARRGNDWQLVSRLETDRHFVGAEGDPRLLGDPRQELGGFVRRGEARADLSDALEVPTGRGCGIRGGRDLRLRRVAGSGWGRELSIGPGRARRALSEPALKQGRPSGQVRRRHRRSAGTDVVETGPGGRAHVAHRPTVSVPDMGGHRYWYQGVPRYRFAGFRRSRRATAARVFVEQQIGPVGAQIGTLTVNWVFGAHRSRRIHA